MGFRFYKRLKILPGITLNLNKKSASISIGTKGAKFTIGPKGNHITLGIPGTGLFYTEKLDKKPKTSSKSLKMNQSNPLELRDYLNKTTTQPTNFLLEGIIAYQKGNLDKALEYFEQDQHLESKFLLGLIYIRKNDYEKALKYFKSIEENKNKKEIGKELEKIQIQPIIKFSISKEIIIETTINLITVYLILTEIYQYFSDLENAFFYLQKAYNLQPDNLFIKLSFVELLYDFALKKNEHTYLKKIIAMTENLQPENFIYSGILFYRALALILLNNIQEALKIFENLLNHSEILSDELKKAIIQERNKILIQNQKITFKEI